jgi:hypothetical protein
VDLKKKAIISLCGINLPAFIAESERIYCVVRTGSSNQTDIVSSLKELM